MENETPSLRRGIKPSLAILPNNIMFGIANKSVFKAENYTIGDLIPLGFPPNSFHVRQEFDPLKELIYFPLDFPPLELKGLSLINRRNPIKTLKTADILGIFNQFDNLKILYLDGFEVDQQILNILISRQIKLLALIRVNGIELKSIACSEIDTIVIEESTWEKQGCFEIEICREIIKD